MLQTNIKTHAYHCDPQNSSLFQNYRAREVKRVKDEENCNHTPSNTDRLIFFVLQHKDDYGKP